MTRKLKSKEHSEKFQGEVSSIDEMQELASNDNSMLYNVLCLGGGLLFLSTLTHPVGADFEKAYTALKWLGVVIFIAPILRYVASRQFHKSDTDNTKNITRPIDYLKHYFDSVSSAFLLYSCSLALISSDFFVEQPEYFYVMAACSVMYFVISFSSKEVPTKYAFFHEPVIKHESQLYKERKAQSKKRTTPTLH